MKKKQKRKDFITSECDKKILKSRAIIALTLLLILFLLCAYHQTNYKYHREYPSVKMIVGDYENSATFQLLEKYDGKTVTFTVLRSNVDVDIGDKVEVLGTLNPDYQISAEKIIVLKRWKYVFIFIRSFIALIFLVFVFMRNWKFDFNHIKFIGRE
jgi:hypothetical protein